jgi:hypothetical protein
VNRQHSPDDFNFFKLPDLAKFDQIHGGYYSFKGVPNFVLNKIYSQSLKVDGIYQTFADVLIYLNDQVLYKSWLLLTVRPCLQQITVISWDLGVFSLSKFDN